MMRTTEKINKAKKYMDGVVKASIARSAQKKKTKTSKKMKSINDSKVLDVYMKELQDIELIPKEDELPTAQKMIDLEIDAWMTSMKIDREEAVQLQHADPDRKKLDAVATQEAMPALKEAVALRDRFARANLRIVIAIAKRYMNRGMELEDLIQEGNIGLIYSIGRFDPSKGFRFSTFTVWWIRHMITRALSDKSRMIRLPVHILEKTYAVTKAKRVLGDEATDDQLIEHTEISKENLELIREISGREFIMLDRPITEGDASSAGEGREIHEIVAKEEPNGTFSERLMDMSMASQISRLLVLLTPGELEVIQHLFGLNGEEPKGLQETSDAIKRGSTSKQRIQQIKKQALGKLYDAAVKNGMRSFIDG